MAFWDACPSRLIRVVELAIAVILSVATIFTLHEDSRCRLKETDRTCILTMHSN